MEPTNSQYETPRSEGTYASSILWGNLEGAASLNDLYTTELVLTKPMSINLQYRSEDRCFIAIQNDLNTWGEATTLQGAERELASEIVTLYRRLSSLQRDQLGPYPQKLLSYLKRFIS